MFSGEAETLYLYPVSEVDRWATASLLMRMFSPARPRHRGHARGERRPRPRAWPIGAAVGAWPTASLVGSYGLSHDDHSRDSATAGDVYPQTKQADLQGNSDPRQTPARIRTWTPASGRPTAPSPTVTRRSATFLVERVPADSGRLIAVSFLRISVLRWTSYGRPSRWSGSGPRACGQVLRHGRSGGAGVGWSASAPRPVRLACTALRPLVMVRAWRCPRRNRRRRWLVRWRGQ